MNVHKADQWPLIGPLLRNSNIRRRSIFNFNFISNFWYFIAAIGTTKGLDQMHHCIWQLLSIKENICPDRHRKSHALQDAKKYFFLYITRKMRSTAFQPCITLGGLHWDEMGQKHDFLKKNALKTAFLGDTILDRLTSEGVGSPKKIKNATFLMLSFNDGP